MGGYGSGARGPKKATVERCTALDTSDLKRLKLLVPGRTEHPGSLVWNLRGDEKPHATIRYRISVRAEGGELRLGYKIVQSGEDLAYTIPLVTTVCHLGGVRWWFVCPLIRNGVACGRRVRKVYLRGQYFGCRRCHGLTYQSTQSSDSRVYAALRRGEHLRGPADVRGMPVAQLGFALKVLTAGQKRLDRIGKRLDRIGGKRAKRKAEAPDA